MSTPSAIVFLPGLLCDDMLWYSQTAALSDIAPTSVANLTQDDSIAAMAKTALKAAPKSFALVALSMGGYVALEIMRQAPERVSHLVLLDTSASTDTPQRAAQRRAGLASLKLGKFMGVTAKLLPQLVHESHLGGPVAEEVQAMALRVGGDAFYRQQNAIIERQDSLPTLATIHVPTLIGVGDSDQITPLPEAEKLHKGISNSKLHIFANCGHLPPLEKPEETNRVLRAFLTA